MNIYNNYHKHDHVSSIITPDTHIKAVEYFERAKELGHTTFFTTNHGTGGDIFEAYLLSEEYGIKSIFGIEGYIVPNPLVSDNRNYHIVIIPKTDKARKKVNIITSRAFIEGFYYKPRIFLEDLLSLDKDDVYITTACVAGIMRDNDSIEQLVMPLLEHFGNNLFFEIQNHNDTFQKEINQKCIEFSKKYGNALIAANDSHYIYPNQAEDRLNYLKGKGISYGGEDSYILDYPDYDTMLERFITQGVLTEEQAQQAIDQTLIFSEINNIVLNKEIKMPSIYPDLSPEQKVELLSEHAYTAFEEVKVVDELTDEEIPTYLQGIKDELQVIKDTSSVNTADYFLFNEKNTDLAINKYGGVLTRTGRGSCSSFYINRLLGMTQIDRFKTPVKLYPERFLSTARILETKSLPDIDFNVVEQEPFVKASRELLGEHGCYPMVAYGTMKMAESFRNICRSYNLSYAKYNEVAKAVETYEDDPEWSFYIKEAKKFVGSIVSISPHPCAHLLLDKDIVEEYGVVRVGDAICVLLTSDEADKFKFLKNDYLVVSCWKLISETFDMIHQPILTTTQLNKYLDNKVWQLYKDGYTNTLNQCDGTWATGLVKKYHPESLRELSMFVAALRPSFESWRDRFINRDDYNTGCEQLDGVLESTNSFILFQENLMQFFEWLGVAPAESISIIKKISKKKIKQSDFDALEDRLHNQWIINVGNDNHFYDIWSMIQSCMSYSFCSAHAVCTAYDSLYSAYLKVNYTNAYYTVCLDTYRNDQGKVSTLISEMKNFDVKVLSPSINKSMKGFIPYKGQILFGLSAITGIGEKLADMIIQERETNGDFKGFDDFLSRVSVNKSNMVYLIKAGAIPTKDKKKTIIKYLESQFIIEPFEYKPVKTYKTKKQMLEKWGIDVDSYKVDGKIDKEKVLEVYNIVREKQLKKDYYARKYAEHQKYIETYTEKYLQDEPLWEFQALQIFLNNNPFDESYKYIKRIFTEIEENEVCVIVGVIAKVEKKKNKMNKQYAFVHIYSTFGIIEALVFAQKYQQYSELLYKGNQIAMLCTKSTDNQVLCDKVKPYNDWLEYSKARAKKGR